VVIMPDTCTMHVASWSFDTGRRQSVGHLSACHLLTLFSLFRGKPMELRSYWSPGTSLNEHFFTCARLPIGDRNRQRPCRDYALRHCRYPEDLFRRTSSALAETPSALKHVEHIKVGFNMIQLLHTWTAFLYTDSTLGWYECNLGEYIIMCTWIILSLKDFTDTQLHSILLAVLLSQVIFNGWSPTASLTGFTLS
jgi:hypothetical protein